MNITAYALHTCIIISHQRGKVPIGSFYMERPLCGCRCTTEWKAMQCKWKASMHIRFITSVSDAANEIYTQCMHISIVREFIFKIAGGPSVSFPGSIKERNLTAATSQMLLRPTQAFGGWYGRKKGVKSMAKTELELRFPRFANRIATGAFCLSTWSA